MKTTAAFNALAANRKANYADARPFRVVSITKKGLPSKMPVHALDMCRTREEAEVRLAYVEKLNPGRKYAIVEV